ncbi:MULTISPECIES: IS5 family transposase [Rhizobium/Agrobacterium group]|uniref:IS5 family transposase n=1 Tax=Rhizobium sp. AB2/73 TaxID=2795216 RepID=UPI001AD9BCB1|nr:MULTISPECIES: IS5 family transposase [Rhizobium/Agrobacterium group]MBO9112786.1 IS5 family transposase [Agrobacterium sp. S2/73]QXZ76066.1 IS5 family transposase [Agrobacterium sp. S7/73]QYA17359.1 IS5 family transposase [Rhizobium sp. AB2/73]UEQ85649.1 IS5 family transposase [Rhizobium sp. AB2/73]
MTRRRYELTDHEWSIISSLLPNKPRGVPRVDDRRGLNGILWRFRTGSPWSEVPERYGRPTTCYNRFVRWRKAGVWDRLLKAVSEAYDGDIVMIDSTCVRVHQHAANGKKGDRDDGCMGRSRGGLTSKIHALVDAEGRPVTLRLTGGQIADCTEADALTDDLGEGDILLADKGYDTNAIRAKAAERKAWANIPPKATRKGSFSFSRWVYRQRNLVERFFNKIKQFRGIATRYDKRPENYLAAVKLVAPRIWCQSL